MEIASQFIVGGQLAFLAALSVLVLQTGAPQTLAAELEDVVGIYVTLCELRQLPPERGQAPGTDYWGSPYRHTVVEEGRMVVSNGPDRQPNTDDDLRVRLIYPLQASMQPTHQANL
ncbi:MAG: hypothetical protein AAFX99_07975 [Myxococcota bacterium]